MNRERQDRPVVVVDGPAGTGKSTVCRLFAEETGYVCLDTGALYRAVAWRAQNRGVSFDDEALARLCDGISIVMDGDARVMRIRADGEEIEHQIRTEEMGMLASQASRLPGVRRALLPLQREAGKDGGIIAEGRDMGTVVFPDAGVKLFLDADPEERARRRYRELVDRGATPEFQALFQDILRRDDQDRNRSIAPLRPSEDAHVIDTTNMTIAEVVAEMIRAWRVRRGEISDL